MRVFVTGATGFVGSAVVAELIAAGHQVLGLARADAAAASLAATGATVHRGSIDDLDSLRRGTEATDGVIHTAFNHDFSQFKANCENDRRVVETFGDVLAGSDRPLIVTSGTGLLTQSRRTTEADRPPVPFHNPRVASEEAADAVAARGVRVSVVRLGCSVHGDGDHAFVPLLINIAREKGVSVYAGEGSNVWPAVHRLDAARLYRLALENHAPAGTRYHGAAEDVTFREIATAIGSRLNVPVVSQSPADAAAHFGWFAHFAAIDNPTSSDRTRAMLGWTPTQVGLLEDLERGRYFE